MNLYEPVKELPTCKKIYCLFFEQISAKSFSLKIRVPISDMRIFDYRNGVGVVTNFSAN